MDTTPNPSNPISVPVESRSEVARLMRQINLEVEAGKQALYGLAEGTARHEVINKRMDNIGNFHEQLEALIGEAAMPIIIEKLDQLNQALPSQARPT